MNRREFLHTGLTGAALGVAPLKLGAGQGDAAKPRIPIGFLGVSYSHGPDKVKLAMSSPDWEFVGVWDETAAGRQECEKLGLKPVSQDEVLRRARVVAV